jgi:hypothetical protein
MQEKFEDCQIQEGADTLSHPVRSGNGGRRFLMDFVLFFDGARRNI